MRRFIIISTIGLALILLGPLARAQEPISTATPYPTYTPYPTFTPAPSATPRPVAPPPPPANPRPIAGLSDNRVIEADAQINDVLLQVERLQSARLAGNAPLVQLAPTHVEPPNGRGAPPDTRARIPDQIDSWYSTGLELPANMVVSIRVDVYDGPRGHGYVVIASMEEDQITWWRSVNVGPETWRESDWRP